MKGPGNGVFGGVFSQLSEMTELEQEQQRLTALAESGLLEAGSIPIFDEATQTAAHFLDVPICILGLIDQDRQWFKSAVGLSRIGLMNDLASSRQLPRHEGFCQAVLGGQTLAISDTSSDPNFAHSLLVRRYGIQAYLGVPLLTSDGFCLGTLAVMDLAPRTFTPKEIAFLELTARWSMSEYERNRDLKHPQIPSIKKEASLSSHLSSIASQVEPALPPSVKVDLIGQMTQELRTPLTSILGMASVLSREIYGPLTEKQKEYMDIVHNSGQYLLSLVNEIMELGSLNDSNRYLNLSPVDIEMLCQQALTTLEQAAQRREQKIRLTVEPGRRIWLLDKDKVRHMLYHLVFTVIQAASADSLVRIHVSRKQERLNLTIWPSHPWLGEGLSHTDLHPNHSLALGVAMENSRESGDRPFTATPSDPAEYALDLSQAVLAQPTGADILRTASRQNLSLMLSQQLAELHGGQLMLQGSLEGGYRYVLSLPQMAETGDTENIR